jgi:hypothetical protein
MTCSPLRIFALLVSGLVATANNTARAADRGSPVYNITLRTDGTPDMTDLPSYLYSITSQYKDPQDKAINIWRWSQKLRKQTSNPAENGQDVLDPILFFNSYGYCNCGIVSGLNNSLWLNMGWKAHYVQLGDHTVCETSWDGGKTWHMFDASMSIYCFNDAGQVASVTEIVKNSRYYLENFAPECATNPVKGPSDPNGWRCGSDWPVQYQRTLANGWDSYRPTSSIEDTELYARWGQRFVLNLRPHEHYTRYFDKQGESPSDPRFFRPLPNKHDPETQHNDQGIRANGTWHYAPNLRDARAADLVYDAAGVTWGDARKGFAVRAADPTQPGTVVFHVSAGNVVTSARLALVVSRLTANDAVEVEVSATAGITYAPLWTFAGTGSAVAADIDLSPLVAGTDEYLVRIRLRGGGSGLESAAIETNTQINRASLPRLVRGPNTIQFVAGQQAETIQFRPAVTGGNHHATVFEEQSVDVEKDPGYYKPTLRPAENGVPCFATWRVQTPTPIVDVTYGATVCVKNPNDRVAMLHSWDGKTFSRDYQKDTDAPPFDMMVNRTVNDVPPGSTQAFLRYEFQTPQRAKSYAGPGIQYAAMTVHHQPRLTGFTPVEVTYCWVEHRRSGDVERRHTQLVTSPRQQFNIDVGGYRDPTMKWVRLNLKGSGPDGDKVAYGYSDGQDVGPGAAAVRERYRWGKNLALGKPYTLSGAQSEVNPDAGGDLTDGIIAPPDTYVSKKYMPTNVIFEKDATSVATIDLGDQATISAVRVHAGQEPGYHLAFPSRIVVETSTDGKTFTRAGEAEHNQVFDPPADFLPWEHDDSPQFASLPAGGRLAYAYRIIFDEPVNARYVRVTCPSQKGWGTMLSEIQVFDKVTVDKDVPPAVVLPALGAGTKDDKVTR